MPQDVRSNVPPSKVGDRPLPLVSITSPLNSSDARVAESFRNTESRRDWTSAISVEVRLTLEIRIPSTMPLRRSKRDVNKSSRKKIAELGGIAVNADSVEPMLTP